MNPIDIFAKRLDEIFEMGMPTKALIYDAFHKATETPISPSPPQVMDEDIKKLIEERFPLMGDTAFGNSLIHLQRDGMKIGLELMRDLLTK